MSPSNRGFTLVELLVVIVVISIFFSLAVVSFNSSDGSEKIEQEAKRFKALIHLAKEKSLFENVDMGLFFYRTGYGFVIPIRTEDPNDATKKITQFYNAANELDDPTFRMRKLPKDMRLSLTVNENDIDIPVEWPEEDSKRAAQAMLFSSGESNPFSIVIDYDDTIQQTISVNELGKTRFSELSYHD